MRLILYLFRRTYFEFRFDCDKIKFFSPMNLRNKGESSAATGASSFLYSLL